MFLVDFLDRLDIRTPRRRSAAAPRNAYVRFWPGKAENTVVSERTGMVCVFWGRKPVLCEEEKEGE
jgi:hypothetical protein